MALLERASSLSSGVPVSLVAEVLDKGRPEEEGRSVGAVRRSVAGFPGSTPFHELGVGGACARKAKEGHVKLSIAGSRNS